MDANSASGYDEDAYNEYSDIQSPDNMPNWVSNIQINAKSDLPDFLLSSIEK